jgi:microfibrillar-associated protein 1
MLNPAKRMTAQPSRPVARYRPGKPAAEEETSDEDESEEEQQQQPQKRQPARLPQPRPVAQAEAEEDDDDEEGFVTDPEGDDDDEGVSGPPPKPAQPAQSNLPISRPPPVSKPQRPTDDDEDNSESDSEDETSESESEASSSEDEPTRKFQRPTFIRKADRTTSATHQPSSDPDSQLEETHTRRLAETESHIAERIQRDALARAAGKKAWDDDDAVPESTVDDTDGLDPEAEHAAWRLRELKRLKRDREAMIEREKEIEELERRRNLTAAEREAEDAEHISKQREEKDSRAQSGYLARYHHKGAFFQDDEVAEVLKKRDVMGATFVDEVDKSVLPEYMRIRDMNKLGKKGRTRYKDLRNEDTGRWGDEVVKWRPGDRRREGGDDMDRAVDARFLPDDDRRGPTASGANASALGERRRRRSYSRERRRSYSRSRSRSRSPQRRKRSPPSDRRVDDEDRGKRRRVVDAV